MLKVLKPSFFADIVPQIMEGAAVFSDLPPCEIADGAVIFSQDHGCSDILSSGWGDPEYAGTWSTSRHARVFFKPRYESRGLFAPLRIALAFVGFTPLQCRQKVEFHIRGEPSVSVEISAADDRLHVVKLVTVNRGQPIAVDIDLPDCIAPRDVMDSLDGRTLGIQMRWIAVAQEGALLSAGSAVDQAVLHECTADEFIPVKVEQVSGEAFLSPAIKFPSANWQAWPLGFADLPAAGASIDFRDPGLDGLSGFEPPEETGRWIGEAPAEFSFGHKGQTFVRSSSGFDLILLMEPYAPPGVSPTLIVNTPDNALFEHRFRNGDLSLRALRVGPFHVLAGQPCSIGLRAYHLTSPLLAVGQVDSRLLGMRLRLASLLPTGAPLPMYTHGLEVIDADKLVGAGPHLLQDERGAVSTRHDIFEHGSDRDGIDNAVKDDPQPLSHGVPSPCSVPETCAPNDIVLHQEELTVFCENAKDTSDRLAHIENKLASLGRKMGHLATQTSGLGTIENVIFRLEEAVGKLRQDQLDQDRQMHLALKECGIFMDRMMKSMQGVIDLVSNTNTHQFFVREKINKIAAANSELAKRTDSAPWNRIEGAIHKERTLTEAALRKLDILARRQIVEVDQQTLALHVEHGYVLVPRRDLRLVLAIHDSVGVYEPGTQSVFAHLLKEGMTAVDVGANIGLHTLCMGRLVGPTGKVWALEPSSEISDCLGRAVEANGLQRTVTVLPVAAGNKQCTAILHVGNTSGLSSLYALEVETDAQEVEMDRLDNLIPAQIDLIKVDAEGAEISVMEGLGLYADHPELVIVAEYALEHLHKNRMSPDQWFGYFESRGFRSFKINDDKGPVLTPKAKSPLDGNYLFIRNEGRVSDLLERLV